MVTLCVEVAVRSVKEFCRIGSLCWGRLPTCVPHQLGTLFVFSFAALRGRCHLCIVLRDISGFNVRKVLVIDLACCIALGLFPSYRRECRVASIALMPQRKFLRAKIGLVPYKEPQRSAHLEQQHGLFLKVSRERG